MTSNHQSHGTSSTTIRSTTIITTQPPKCLAGDEQHDANEVAKSESAAATEDISRF